MIISSELTHSCSVIMNCFIRICTLSPTRVIKCSYWRNTHFLVDLTPSDLFIIQVSSQVGDNTPLSEPEHFYIPFLFCLFVCLPCLFPSHFFSCSSLSSLFDPHYNILPFLIVISLMLLDSVSRLCLSFLFLSFPFFITSSLNFIWSFFLPFSVVLSPTTSPSSSQRRNYFQELGYTSRPLLLLNDSLTPKLCT